MSSHPRSTSSRQRVATRRVGPGRWQRASVAVLAAGALMLSACADDSEAAGDVEQQLDEGVDAAQDAVDEAQEQVDAGEVDADAVDEQAAELADTLRANGMESFASIIEQVDVSAIVQSEEFTILGPNDEAFLALEADATADLLSDPAQLDDIIENHILPQRVDAEAVIASQSIETQGGTILGVTTEGDTVMIGDATVVQTDIAVGDNGIIHVIDRVILP